MSKIEDVAVRLWKADSEDAGVPASIAKGRTLEAFRDQSDETRAKWFKFARAAIEAMREPTDFMEMCGGAAAEDAGVTATNDDCGLIFEAMISAALREEGR